MTIHTAPKRLGFRSLHNIACNTPLYKYYPVESGSREHFTLCSGAVQSRTKSSPWSRSQRRSSASLGSSSERESLATISLRCVRRKSATPASIAFSIACSCSSLAFRFKLANSLSLFNWNSPAVASEQFSKNSTGRFRGMGWAPFHLEECLCRIERHRLFALGEDPTTTYSTRQVGSVGVSVHVCEKTTGNR